MWFFIFTSAGLPVCSLHAIDHKGVINDFVSLHKDLHALELSEAEWDAIVQVATWLEMFQTATMEMSHTKQSILSTTHLIFRRLQEHIWTIIADLPDNFNSQLKAGLLAAHQKLSEYYYHFDQSPFYTWATCKHFYCKGSIAV